MLFICLFKRQRSIPNNVLYQSILRRREVSHLASWAVNILSIYSLSFSLSDVTSQEDRRSIYCNTKNKTWVLRSVTRNGINLNLSTSSLTVPSFQGNAIIYDKSLFPDQCHPFLQYFFTNI